MIEILGKDPSQTPPHYESLVGDLWGTYSRRINIQHRLVYQVLEEEKAVKVLRYVDALWQMIANKAVEATPSGAPDL